MKREEILKKCIERVNKRGGLKITHSVIWQGTEEILLFDHSFCKAFWGEDCKGFVNKANQLICHKYCRIKDKENAHCYQPLWQYHIQQLALAEDRLKYMEKFL